MGFWRRQVLRTPCRPRWVCRRTRTIRSAAQPADDNLSPCSLFSLYFRLSILIVIRLQTLQCRGSGKFIAQNADSFIVSSDGTHGEGDYTVQWRFISKDYPYYTLVNRKTGHSLHNISGNLLGATKTTSSEFYWSLDAAGADISITNVLSSNIYYWSAYWPMGRGPITCEHKASPVCLS